MLKNLIIKSKEKNGAGTIVTLVMLIAFIPLLLFTLVDVPYYNQYHRKIKDIADTTAASAITRIQEDMLASGTLNLDYDKARTVMFESLQKWFSLDPYLYESNASNVYIMRRHTPENSMLDKDPLVIELRKNSVMTASDDVKNSTRIEFFVHTDNSTATYTFTTGSKVKVSTPTVGVYVQTTMHGIYFNYPMTVRKYGISEVVLDPYLQTP